MKRTWIVLIIVCLAGVQLLWWYTTFRAADREFTSETSRRLARLAKLFDEDAYCFELNSSVALEAGSDLFLLTPSGNGNTDTLTTYFIPDPGVDTVARHQHLSFGADVLVDISLQFNYPLPERPVGSDGFSPTQQIIVDHSPNVVWAQVGNKQFPLLDSALLFDLANEELLGEQREKADLVVSDTSRSAVFLTSHGAAVEQTMSEGAGQVLFGSRRLLPPLLLSVRYPDRTAALVQAQAPMGLAFLLLSVALVAMLLNHYRSVREQRKLARMQMDLVSNITHEFNTPITNINLALDTLQGNGNGQQIMPVDQLLQIVRVESERLRGNINKVLQVSLLEGGTLSFDQQWIDIHELIEAMVVSVQPALTQAQVTLECSLGANRSWVYIDRTYIANVLHGMVDNAIKYGGTNIDIRTEDDPAGILMDVVDNGPGIPREDHELIFEKFYRVNVLTSELVPGTGTGLYFARRIIEAHDGWIKVMEGGAGAWFRLLLPNFEKERPESVGSRRRPEPGTLAGSEPA